MYEIRRVDIKSAVKIGAVVTLGLAVVCPPIVAFLAGFLEEVIFTSRPDLMDAFEYLLDDDFWEFYIPFVPIITIGGLLIGAVVAFVYNFICARIGGLKLEILFSDESQNIQPIATEIPAEKIVTKNK